MEKFSLYIFINALKNINIFFILLSIYPKNRNIFSFFFFINKIMYFGKRIFSVKMFSNSSL